MNGQEPDAAGVSRLLAELADPSLTAADLLRLSQNGEQVAQAVIGHVNAGPALLFHLAEQYPDHAMVTAANMRRNELVRDPGTSPEFLTEFVETGTWIERSHVAMHPNVPVTLLEALSADPHPSVRADAALNRRVTASLVDAFAVDPEPRVRMLLASNPVISDDVLARLAADRDANVARTAGKRVLRRAARRVTDPAVHEVAERLVDTWTSGVDELLAAAAGIAASATN